MKKRIGMAAVIILLAVIGVIVLMAHADENIFGVTYTDKAIKDIEALEKIDSIARSKSGHSDTRVYIIDEVKFGKYKEKYRNKIPEGKDIYANLNIIAAPEGMKFKAKWLYEGRTMKEETKALSTPQKGVIWYLLDGNQVNKGNYTFEVYYKDKRLYKKDFAVE